MFDGVCIDLFYLFLDSRTSHGSNESCSQRVTGIEMYQHYEAIFVGNDIRGICTHTPAHVYIAGGKKTRSREQWEIFNRRRYQIVFFENSKREYWYAFSHYHNFDQK